MLFTYFVYFSILICGTLFSYCAEKSKSKDVEYIWRFLLFLIFLLPAIFRYDIGADYSEYKRLYDDNLYWGYAEIGFCLICDLLNFFGCSSFWMFFFIAFFTYFLVCFFIKKQNFCIFIFFYIAFYGYINAFDQIRQALALPFIIFAIYSLLENKYKKMCVFILVSSLFHKSSLIFFILLPISKIKIGRVTVIFLTLLFSVFIYFIDYVAILHYLSSIANFRYLLLLTNSIEQTATLGLGLLLKIMYPLMFICTLSYSKNNLSTSESIGSNFGLMYIVLSFLVLKIDIFNRLRDVIWVGLLYSITVIPKSKYRKLIIYFVCISGILLYYILIKNSNLPGTKEISPYQTIFD